MKLYFNSSNCLLVLLVFLGCAKRHEYRAVKEVPYDSISRILQEIGSRDQAIRHKYLDSVGHDNPNREHLLSEMRKVDSLNILTLTLILEKYGWPPKSKVGDLASEDAFIVVQHSKTEVMERYFPQLKRLADQGEASKANAAMMEDRLRMRRGKKQIYGSQVSADLDANHTRLVWPIENPSIVDSLRKAVGFELSVLENAKRLDAVYDTTVKLPVLDRHP